MMCLYIHTKYCPKCSVFKFGSVMLGESVFRAPEEEKTAYDAIKELCYILGIPLIDVDVGEDYTVDVPPILRGDVVMERRLPLNTNRYWMSRVLQKPTLELPGFVIMSDITGKNRYIDIEIITEGKSFESYVVSKWSAVRQVFRNLARTAIEEKLTIANVPYDSEKVNKILERLFPVNERGEPKVMDWVRAHLRLRHMRIDRNYAR